MSEKSKNNSELRLVLMPKMGLNVHCKTFDYLTNISHLIGCIGRYLDALMINIGLDMIDKNRNGLYFLAKTYFYFFSSDFNTILIYIIK